MNVGDTVYHEGFGVGIVKKPDHGEGFSSVYFFQGQTTLVVVTSRLRPEPTTKYFVRADTEHALSELSDCREDACALARKRAASNPGYRFEVFRLETAFKAESVVHEVSP